MSIYAEISEALDEVFTDVTQTYVDVNLSGGGVVSRVKAFVSRQTIEEIALKPNGKVIFRADDLKNRGLWDEINDVSLFDAKTTFIFDNLLYRLWTVKDFGKIEAKYVATTCEIFLDCFYTGIDVYRPVPGSGWNDPTESPSSSILGFIQTISGTEDYLHNRRFEQVSEELYCYYSGTDILVTDEIEYSGIRRLVLAVLNEGDRSWYKKILLERKP